MILKNRHQACMWGRGMDNREEVDRQVIRKEGKPVEKAEREERNVDG